MPEQFVFVEEYRKELSESGYPFVAWTAGTDTGFALPPGFLVDASVYYERADAIPKLTSLERTEHNTLRLMFGVYTAEINLRTPEELVELSDSGGVFGGIILPHPEHIRIFQGWPIGRHTLERPMSLVPRATVYIPVAGVHRFKTDTGESFYGDVAMIAEPGSQFVVTEGENGRPYVVVHFTGDPTYGVRTGVVAEPKTIQVIVCINAEGQDTELVPDEKQGIRLISCNTNESNLYEEALHIHASGSSVLFSMAGS